MFKRIFQCFESGMMYSGCGSGSRYDILELRIWIPILPMLFKHIWTLLKKEESANYLPFSISHWKKFTGINLEIQFKFICSSFLPEPDLKQMVPDSLTTLELSLSFLLQASPRWGPTRPAPGWAGHLGSPGARPHSMRFTTTQWG